MCVIQLGIWSLKFCLNKCYATWEKIQTQRFTFRAFNHFWRSSVWSFSHMITSSCVYVDPWHKAEKLLEADNMSCSWTPGPNWPRHLLGGRYIDQRTAGELIKEVIHSDAKDHFWTKTAFIDLLPHMTACFHWTERTVSNHIIKLEPAPLAENRLWGVDAVQFSAKLGPRFT